MVLRAIPIVLVASMIFAGCSGGGGRSGGIGPIPPIDPIQSSVTVSPPQLIADGLEIATVTITLVDTLGDPVAGAAGSIAVTGTGNIVTQPMGVSGSDGVLTATIASVVAEIKTITTTAVQTPATPPLVLDDEPTVDFQPDPNHISGILSSVTANPVTGLLANGIDSSLITVTVRDVNNNLVPGKAVEITASGTGNTLVGSPGVTDMNGVVTATLTTTVAGVKTVTATVDAGTPGAVVVDDHPMVEFTPVVPCVSALLSMVTANPTINVLANGADTSTITVTVIDTSMGPVAGVTVNLAASGSGGLIVGSPGVTDANGIMIATITSTVAEAITITATSDAFGPCPQATLAQTATVQFVNLVNPCDPISRASVSSAGVEGDHKSHKPSISSDARFVAFESKASNLVPGDTNGEQDIFVRDVIAGTTERVSLTNAGAEFDEDSKSPSISGDGRYVAFQVEGDHSESGHEDTEIHVRDRLLSTTELIPGPAGSEENKKAVLSGAGRYVAFVSKTDNSSSEGAESSSGGAHKQIWLYDRQTSTLVLVTAGSSGAPGSGNSDDPSISADGRFIAFTSKAEDLVSTDSNNKEDIFVYDHLNGTIALVNVGPGGVQANHKSSDPSISADGTYVAFRSHADNLVIGDSNSHKDVFIRDLVNNITELVSVSSLGAQGNNHSSEPSLSGDGRYVAYVSKATNLVPGDTNSKEDVFILDRQTGMVQRASLSASGTQGNHKSSEPAMSAGGGCLAFASKATNLVPNGTNSHEDVFVAPRN